MKKQIIIAILSIIPAVSFAKISDFNELIGENVKAQNELHNTVKAQLNETRDKVAAQKGRERIVIVENSSESYNTPTKKDFFAFKKEKINHRASEEKQFERLATELKDLE